MVLFFRRSWRIWLNFRFRNDSNSNGQTRIYLPLLYKYTYEQFISSITKRYNSRTVPTWGGSPVFCYLTGIPDWRETPQTWTPYTQGRGHFIAQASTKKQCCRSGSYFSVLSDRTWLFPIPFFETNFFPDPFPDPDPAKNFGWDRIRIHNTVKKEPSTRWCLILTMNDFLKVMS